LLSLKLEGSVGCGVGILPAIRTVETLNACATTEEEMIIDNSEVVLSVRDLTAEVDGHRFSMG